MDIRYIGIDKDAAHKTPAFEVKANVSLPLWRDVLCLYGLIGHALLQTKSRYDKTIAPHVTPLAVASLLNVLEHEKAHGRAGVFSLKDILVASESILLFESRNSIYRFTHCGISERLLRSNHDFIIDALGVLAAGCIASIREVREIFLQETGRADRDSDLSEMQFRLGMEFFTYSPVERLEDILDVHLKALKRYA